VDILLTSLVLTGANPIIPFELPAVSSFFSFTFSVRVSLEDAEGEEAVVVARQLFELVRQVSRARNSSKNNGIYINEEWIA
jgi:hypothetical protein